jgi:hypothetical protein
VDIAGVVGWTIVQQRSDGRKPGGGGAVTEGVDNGRGVLLVADGGAGEGGAVGVHEQLEVEGEGFAVEREGELGAVADPLRTRGEGLEGLAQGGLVGRGATAVDGTRPEGLERVADVVLPAVMPSSREDVKGRPSPSPHVWVEHLYNPIACRTAAPQRARLDALDHATAAATASTMAPYSGCSTPLRHSGGLRRQPQLARPIAWRERLGELLHFSVVQRSERMARS